WNIYTPAELSGLDLVESYFDYYFPNGMMDYPGGTAPGYYRAELVESAQMLESEVNDAINSGNCTDEEAEALCERIQAMYEALHADGARIPLADGYYYLHDSRNPHYYLNAGQTADGQGYVAANNTTIPEVLDLASTGFVWHVTAADSTDLYYLQNLKTGDYMTAQAASLNVGGATNELATLGSDKGRMQIAADGGYNQPSFIINPYGASNKLYNTYTTVKAVGYWNDKNDPGNCFRFERIDEAEIEAINDQIRQAYLNETLQAAFNRANSAYKRGISLKSNCDADGETAFTGEDALINDASQFFANATEPTEGNDFNLLLDGLYDTFYHSEWSTTSTQDKHFIGFEIPEALQYIEVKMAKRTKDTGWVFPDCPSTVDVYACNDMADGYENADWQLQGSAEVKYTTHASYSPDGETVYENDNFIGRVGLQLDQPYRYIRLDVTTSTGTKYFNLSEMQAWPAEIDWNSSNINVVAEATRTELEKQLAAALAELKEGKATQETIDALKAITEQFLSELPDPTRLTEAIAEAQAVADGAANLTGDEVGYYPTEAYEALTAAIAEAEAAWQPIMELDVLNAALDKLAEAVATFQASVRLPEAGKYYTLRGRSTKTYNEQLVSYNAQVYSKNNAIEYAVWFTRPDGASLGDIEAELIDTVDAADNLKYLWLIEKAEAGRIVLRNVGTGMYLAPKEGKILQSTEPAEITVYLAQAGIFMLDAGDGYQMNANAAGDVVGWKDMTDENAWWGFEEVNAASLSNAYNTYWEAKPGIFQIMTLPLAVDFAYDGTMYQVVGITSDNELALAEYDDPVPGGTPFIFQANDELELNGVASFNIYYGDEGLDLSMGGSPLYGLEPQSVMGLVGTVCQPDTIGVGHAYLDEGFVMASGKNTVIGENSGYISNAHMALPEVDAASADALLSLGEVVIDGIDPVHTVILPRTVDVYTMGGTLVRRSVSASKATQGLPAGLYIIGGKKILVK
ncbi:MAG: hypothetical protein ACI3YD_06355, partial [Alloprevotella sp.]